MATIRAASADDAHAIAGVQSGAGSAAVMFDGASPTRSASRGSTWWVSTLRDQPYSRAAVAYQSRLPTGEHVGP